MADLTPWQRLQQAELVEGDVPNDTQPHWSSRFLLGMVGWIAALFLLFFLFMSFSQLTRDANSALMMGVVLMAIAYSLNRFAQRNATSSDLVDQFVLALALAADAWLLYGLIDQIDPHSAPLWLGLALLSLAIAALFEHWLVRLFHSFAAAILLTMGLACLGLQLLALPEFGLSTVFVVALAYPSAPSPASSTVSPALLSVMATICRMEAESSMVRMVLLMRPRPWLPGWKSRSRPRGSGPSHHWRRTRPGRGRDAAAPPGACEDAAPCPTPSPCA